MGIIEIDASVIVGHLNVPGGYRSTNGHYLDEELGEHRTTNGLYFDEGQGEPRRRTD